MRGALSGHSGVMCVLCVTWRPVPCGAQPALSAEPWLDVLRPGVLWAPLVARWAGDRCAVCDIDADTESDRLVRLRECLLGSGLRNTALAVTPLRSGFPLAPTQRAGAGKASRCLCACAGVS